MSLLFRKSLLYIRFGVDSPKTSQNMTFMSAERLSFNSQNIVKKNNKVEESTSNEQLYNDE